MLLDIRTCPACGRPFIPVHENRWCRRCTAERQEKIWRVQDAVFRLNMTTLDAISAQTGLPVDEVRQLVRQSPLLSYAVDAEVECVRCKRRPAQPNSRFCLDCRTALHLELGEAADELAKDMTYEPQYPQRPTGLLSALEEKRDRANTSIVRRRPQRLK